MQHWPGQHVSQLSTVCTRPGHTRVSSAVQRRVIIISDGKQCQQARRHNAGLPDAEWRGAHFRMHRRWLLLHLWCTGTAMTRCYRRVSASVPARSNCLHATFILLANFTMRCSLVKSTWCSSPAHLRPRPGACAHNSYCTWFCHTIRFGPCCMGQNLHATMSPEPSFTWLQFKPALGMQYWRCHQHRARLSRPAGGLICCDFDHWTRHHTFWQHCDCFSTDSSCACTHKALRLRRCMRSCTCESPLTG